jgi:hypothetical protein
MKPISRSVQKGNGRNNRAGSLDFRMNRLRRMLFLSPPSYGRSREIESWRMGRLSYARRAPLCISKHVSASPHRSSARASPITQTASFEIIAGWHRAHEERGSE